MPYKSEIRLLTEQNEKLEVALTKHNEDPLNNAELITKMQEQKFTVYNQLRRLVRAQWEEDHERVNLDDDR